jgi:methyl-accepting chemotaxis protein
MRIADWKIGTKLIVGFLAVVAILGAAIGYQILTLQNLAKLQDIGAKRAADALEIKNIVNRLDEVYGVIADGEINRNMEKTLKEFEQVKTTAQQDIGAVRGLVDTAEEKTWAETFATQYNQYLDRFEKEMLPILKKGDLTQKRFDDALAINTIARRVDAVYGVIADAVINRNMEKSLKEFEQVKAAAQQDITTVRGMVDTTEEKAWAETFAEQYNQYLNHFEKEMLPILKKGDVSRKRFDDAVAINNIGRRVEEVHGVMADAVINRDLEAARKDFEPMKVAAQQDIAAVRGLVDTAEEKTWAETFAAQYPQYLDLFEQQMLPALQKSDLSDWEAIRALDENIDRLREATLAPLNAIDQSLTRESEQAAQDAAKITTLDGEIDEMRLATVRPLNDMLKALERESLEATQDVNKVRELDAEIDTLRAAAIVPLDSINTSLTQESVDADKQFDVVRQRAVRLASILSISGCILALIIAWFITISITRPLGKIVLAANNVVQGDLTKDIPIRQRDEIGVLAESFRKMTGKVVGVLQEMERLIHAIQDGKLDQRGDIKTFDGSWRDLVAGSNNVVDALMAPFNVAVEYIDRIAKGDIPVKITDDYKGDFNEMKNNLNMLIDAMNDIAQVAEQIAIGNLNLTVRERSEHDRLMKALNVMISALDDVVKLAEEMADGNLMVEVHERSDEDKLMQALNTMIRRLNEVVTRRDGTGVGGRRSFFLDGTDGGEYQTKCRQCLANRKDRRQSGCGCN